jgi:hypothetical protein
VVEIPSCYPDFSFLLNCISVYVSLSNVALVSCLGVRSLTEEE